MAPPPPPLPPTAAPEEQARYRAVGPPPPGARGRSPARAEPSGSDIISLNIGGEKVVQRRRSTMCAAKGSLLTSRFSGGPPKAPAWRYHGEDGYVLAIRSTPDIHGPKSGNTLEPGEVFRVSEERRGADGINYLHLADGRGWVFERKPGVGVLCSRLEEHDRDEHGRHFINYSPELFMPLLEYLGMKEIEVPGRPVQPPRGPPHKQAEFEAMLRDFGVVPLASLGEVRRLDSMSIPYEAAPWWAYGLAFEIRANSRAALLTALETCGVAKDRSEVPCSVHVCEGPLAHMLSRRNAWQQAGKGQLLHRRASRIELAPPVVIRANVAHCVYIATDLEGQGCGVAFGAPTLAGIAAFNEDLQVSAGHFSTRFDDFSTGDWYPFTGRLEYVLMD